MRSDDSRTVGIRPSSKVWWGNSSVPVYRSHLERDVARAETGDISILDEVWRHAILTHNESTLQLLAWLLLVPWKAIIAENIRVEVSISGPAWWTGAGLVYQGVLCKLCIIAARMSLVEAMVEGPSSNNNWAENNRESTYSYQLVAHRVLSVPTRRIKQDGMAAPRHPLGLLPNLLPYSPE